MTRITIAHGVAGLLLILMVVPSLSLRCYQKGEKKFCGLDVKYCRRAEKIINSVTNETELITECDGDPDATPTNAICETHLGGVGCQVHGGVGTICCCSSDLCNSASSSSAPITLLGISAICSVIIAFFVRN